MGYVLAVGHRVCLSAPLGTQLHEIRNYVQLPMAQEQDEEQDEAPSGQPGQGASKWKMVLKIV